ncbi:MAG: alpha/beta hydrolase fold domain-containing protein [Planctomycetes bacterium]|nr:alpha/beta hydrolase fold domain-containing protein [Planctomycetota bacterium]
MRQHTRRTMLLWGVFVIGLAPWVWGAQPRAVRGPRRAMSQRARFQPTRAEVFKKVGDTELKMHIFLPAGHQPTDRRAAVVFFFGGGWMGGNPRQFFPQCYYLAKRGMIAMAAEYRVYSRHKARIIDCIEDAKSAIRWVRKHADRLGVDPKRIAAGGGSAGGHLAAAVGTLDEFDNPKEDLSVSSRPNALVLFNPALDLTAEGFRLDPKSIRYQRMAKRMGAEAERISPLFHVRKGTPPCIIFHGKADTTVPYEQAERFARRMKEVGNRCELIGYDGEPHGFFNFGRSGNKPFLSTMEHADRFLVSLGYLQGPPTLEKIFGPPRPATKKR